MTPPVVQSATPLFEELRSAMQHEADHTAPRVQHLVDGLLSTGKLLFDGDGSIADQVQSVRDRLTDLWSHGSQAANALNIRMTANLSDLDTYAESLWGDARLDQVEGSSDATLFGRLWQLPDQIRGRNEQVQKMAGYSKLVWLNGFPSITSWRDDDLVPAAHEIIDPLLQEYRSLAPLLRSLPGLRWTGPRAAS